MVLISNVLGMFFANVLIFAFFIVLRDIEERGRDLENVLFQYTNLVKPAFEEFCLPVSIMNILRLTRHLTK